MRARFYALIRCDALAGGYIQSPRVWQSCAVPASAAESERTSHRSHRVGRRMTDSESTCPLPNDSRIGVTKGDVTWMN